MKQTQHVGVQCSGSGRDDAKATLLHVAARGIYFFLNRKATLQQGYVSVTPNVCDEGGGINPFIDSLDLNRRLRCPKASKHSQHLPSLQSSQHVVALLKTKKLLSLSQLSKSQLTTSTKILAGRASRYAPQYPLGLTAAFERSAKSFPNLEVAETGQFGAGFWRAIARAVNAGVGNATSRFFTQVTTC